MSDIIEQQETCNVYPCGWGAKRFWVAVIRCPVWNFDSDVLNRKASCHPQEA